MPPTVTVSNEDVVAALGASERFPVGSPQFEVFALFIGHLVEIVGENHLDEIVEFGNLNDVTGRYLSWLAANDEFLGKLSVDEAKFLKVYYGITLAGLQRSLSDDPELALTLYGLSPEAALVSDGLGLNEAAKKLVHSGELTFAKLLTTSPAVFIPRSRYTALA